MVLHKLFEKESNNFEQLINFSNWGQLNIAFIFPIKRLELHFRMNSLSINELNSEECTLALLTKLNSQSLENFSHNIYSIVDS